ncbi:hypothetical protein [Microtetraspora sp. NBRC 13810]|uniref:hypothetical protein n=1 Tax=Microtetraspora sp. NBRC 13810 TaxID=3030990 RepID=UPI0025535BDD|nr:hypothetical protein [Microtetraspora sp. NBRC 13810]
MPLVGARRRDRLAESVASASLKPDPAALARIEAAVPAGAAAGARYADVFLQAMDSER